MLTNEELNKGYVSFTEIKNSASRDDAKLYVDNSLSQGDEIVLPENIEDLPVKIQDLVINGVPVMRDGETVKFSSLYLRIIRRGKELMKEVGASILSKRIHDAKTDTSLPMQGEPVKDFMDSGAEYVIDAWASFIERGVRSIKVTNVTAIDAATWKDGSWDNTTTRKAKLYTFAYGTVESKASRTVGKDAEDVPYTEVKE